MDDLDMDAWVRFTDFELGGDALWFAEGDVVYDAESDILCRAVNADAAMVIAAAMNLLYEAAEGPIATKVDAARRRVAEAKGK